MSRATRNLRTPRQLDRAERRRLGRKALRALTDGTLTLGQIVGLTEDELAALGRAADTYRRAGRTSEAIAVIGLLAAHAPLRAASWRALPALLRQSGQPLAADACAAVVAALAGEAPGSRLPRTNLSEHQRGQGR